MDPAFRFAPGTVGYVLQEPAAAGMVGLSVAHAGVTLTLEELAFDPGHPKAGWGCVARWRFRMGERTFDIGQFVSLGGELLLPADLQPRARCAEVLERALATWEGELTETHAEELLLALRHPPTPASFAGWMTSHGLAYLTDDGVIACVSRGDRSWELAATSLALRTQSASLLFRLTAKMDDRIDDVVEQEAHVGHVSAEAYLAPASALDGPAFIQLARDWRGVVRASLATRVAKGGPLPMPSDVLEVPGASDVVSVMSDWLVHGPPPPRPRAWKPSKARLGDQATRVRKLGPKTIAALPRGMRDVRLGYRIDGWDVLLAPGLKGAKLGADRILLREGKGAPFVLLRSDDEIQNRLKYTIDGDAPAMRRLLTWLRTLLAQAGFREHFDVVWPYAKDVERRPVDTWLTFERAEHPLDWRRSRDHIEDDHPYWDANDAFLAPLPPARRRRVEELDIPAYYRFYRSMIDATFVGKRETPSRSQRS